MKVVKSACRSLNRRIVTVARGAQMEIGKKTALDRHHDAPSWPWQIRQNGKGADVVVRVHGTDFRLHKVFLENGSRYFERVFAKAAAVASCTRFQEYCEGPMVVELPEFPRRADIFAVAMDYCYGKVDHAISDDNVEDLIAANIFLEVRILKSMIDSFLKANVHTSPQKCLQFLSMLTDEVVRDSVAIDCRNAFLWTVMVPCPFESSPGFEVMFCDIANLPLVAELLPLYMADDFYESIVDEKLSLFFQGDDDSTPVAIKIPRSSKYPAERKLWTTTRPDIFTQDLPPGVLSWMRKLPKLLPDVKRRALCFHYLAKAVRIEPEARVSISFLCALLVEMTKLSQLHVLKEEVNNLEREVGKYLNCLSAAALQECEYVTLLSLVKHFSNVDEDMKTPFCTSVDICLREKLKSKSFSVQQALRIYEHLPNQVRDMSGHNTLYTVFEDAVREKQMSVQERHELSRILDFDKISDKLVERLCENLDLGYEPPLLRRSMEIVKKKCTRFNSSAKTERDREKCLILSQIIQCNILMAKQNHVLTETVALLCKNQGLEPPVFQDEAATGEDAGCTTDAPEKFFLNISTPWTTTSQSQS